MNICDGSYGHIELLYTMVSNMVVNSAMSMFCSLRNLFDILRSLWALYILYDAISACHIPGEISTRRVK